MSKNIVFNYDHPETSRNQDNIYEFNSNFLIKGLKEDFRLTWHLADDFERSFFNDFTNEECFLMGIAIGRGLLTLEDGVEK